MGAYKFSFRDELICKQSHPRGDKLWALVDAVFARLVPCEEVQYLDLSPKHGPGAVADVKSGKDKLIFLTGPQNLRVHFRQASMLCRICDFTSLMLLQLGLILRSLRLGLSPFQRATKDHA
jgi:hypothetical protein